MALYDRSYVVEFKDNTQILIGEVNVPEPIEYREYTVAEDETLFDISRKFFQKTTLWFLISELNDIVDPIVLTPGDTLKIPVYE